MYEPTIKQVAKKNNLEFRTIQGEEMPEEIRPKYFYFYLRKDNEVLEDGFSLMKGNLILF